jgi:hypothetical protein
MAQTTYQQTDTNAPDGVIFACAEADNASPTAIAKTADQNGTAGSSFYTIDILGLVGGQQQQTIALCFESPAGQPGLTSWPAGQWSVSFNVFSSAGNPKLTACYICRVSHTGASLATVGSATNLNTPIPNVPTGYSVLIQGSAQTANATDRFYVVLIFTDALLHGGQITVQSNETVIAPFSPSTLNFTKSESITVTDTPHVTKVNLFTQTENITVSDSLGAMLVAWAIDGATDTITISESISLQQLPIIINQLSESISVSDDVFVEIPGWTFNISVGSESITVTDTATTITFFNEISSLSESITVDDSSFNVIVTGVFPTISETITVTDTPNVLSPDPGVISLSDLVGITESFSIRLSDPVISVSDTITISDSFDMAITKIISASETITVSDSPSMFLAFPIVVAETIHVGESFVIQPNPIDLFAPSETINISDAPNMTQEYNVAASETIAISESRSLSLTSFLTHSEHIIVTDTPFVRVDSLVTGNETVTVTDSFSIVQEWVIPTITETISVSDVFTPVSIDTLHISKSDTIQVHDHPDIALENSIILTAETVNISESITIQSDLHISVSPESITVSDQQSQIQIDLHISVTDVISIHDHADIKSDMHFSVSDSIAVSDQAFVSVMVGFSFDETISISESIVMSLDLKIRLEPEEVTITDIAVLVPTSAFGPYFVEAGQGFVP